MEAWRCNGGGAGAAADGLVLRLEDFEAPKVCCSELPFLIARNCCGDNDEIDDQFGSSAVGVQHSGGRQRRGEVIWAVGREW
ncbi:hypothetical protein M0R45_015750 [Rubus argutus]|uniref:Uncharacterized protein n=1 Tax=Rubus argutus TaxID=59490 RepID=A0AAW1XRT0_RUBAR